MESLTPLCLDKYGFLKKDKLFEHEANYLCRLRNDLARIDEFRQEVDQLNEISDTTNKQHYGCELSSGEENPELIMELNKIKKTLEMQKEDLQMMDTMLLTHLKEHKSFDDGILMKLITALSNIEGSLLLSSTKINRVIMFAPLHFLRHNILIFSSQNYLKSKTIMLRLFSYS